MTKKELARTLSDKKVFSSVSEAEKKLEAIIDAMAETIKKEKSLSIVGFGKWEVSRRAARMGRNPKTGAEIKIPARNALKFRPGKKLVDSLN
ncbi:MAG: HU family DNA-binding protein [Fusobacteriaceae bacterium]